MEKILKKSKQDMKWDKLRHELLLENSEQDVIITHEQYLNDITSCSLFLS